MRNLTIQRQKSFVACLGKVGVWVEDAEGGTLTIDGTSCRKLGELKNGETKNFLIDDREQKVFVIVDQLSKDWCYDVYPLPAGTEDIFLTGKHKYAPHSGNPFRFDNNPSPVATASRKKSSKRGTLIMIGAVIVGLLIGLLPSFLGPDDSEPKTFTSDGIQLTLTHAFNKMDIEDFTVTYASQDVAVYILKEDFTLMEGLEDYTLEQYGALLCESNAGSLAGAEFTTTDGLTSATYSYTDPDSNETYHYIIYIYKSSDSFWMVQFALSAEDLEAYKPQIIEWAKSVTFVN